MVVASFARDIYYLRSIRVIKINQLTIRNNVCIISLVHFQFKLSFIMRHSVKRVYYVSYCDSNVTFDLFEEQLCGLVLETRKLRDARLKITGIHERDIQHPIDRRKIDK